jgi:antitoxin component of MazEF toxin-antitoxin module
MKMIISKAKRWGGSFGLLISKKDAERLKLKENQEVTVEVTPRTNVLKEFYGSGKTKIDTEKVLKEIRKNESKFI